MFRCSTSMSNSSSPRGNSGSITSACCGNTPKGRTTLRSPYGSGLTGLDYRREVAFDVSLGLAHEGGDQIDGHGKDGGRSLLGADLHQRLQVAQLQRGRVRVDDVRRHAQLLRCLIFAFGSDDFRAPLALRFGLPGHRALHLRRQVELLHFHGSDLDAPGLGVLIEDLLQLLVDLLPLREQVVEVELAQSRTQGRLRELGGRVEEVLHLDDGPLGIDDPEVDHRRDLQADVVAGDHVLRRHVARHRAQVDLHHPIDAGNDPIEAGALGLGEAAQAKDDAGFILLDDAQSGDDPEADGKDENQQQRTHGFAFVSALSGATSRVRPRTAMTMARSPGEIGLALAAFHNSPETSTRPPSSRETSSSTSPTSPTSEYAPVRSGLPALLEIRKAREPAMAAMARPMGVTKRQPRPKSESAKNLESTWPMRSNEPITTQTAPAAMKPPWPPM